jgi:plasmid stability protein
MFDRITIRAIPRDIANALTALATRQDRSVEAEARFALKSHTDPVLMHEERSARRAEVSGRLRELTDRVNEARSVSPFRPSHIALAIGEDHAEPVEKWFTGELEPSFSQLARVAEYLGGNVQWLQHGDGQPFTVHYGTRMPEDPGAGVQWLLDIEDGTPKVDHLRLVRSGDKTGKLAIIKQYRPHHCKTYTTPYHISEEIGAGGESSLTWLSLIFNLLYKYYTHSGKPLLNESRIPTGLVISSYILPDSGFTTLTSGRAHPLAVLRDAQSQPWWEDIWDPDQYGKDQSAIYWPGWRALCERIYQVVEHDPRRHEILDLINSGNHPLLS